MATMLPPQKNTEYIFYTGLISQADTKLLKAAPTIAAGDFKVSIDGGAFANLATLPVVTPAAGTAVKITLSAAEMNGDNIVVTCIDAAGAEWCDLFLNVQTSAQSLDTMDTNIDSILTDTGTTLDTLIKDIPTIAEFEARSILAADYVVVGDTIAGVTAVTNDVGITQAGADKVRASVCVTGDPANSIGKALHELYTNRLTSTRAGYLDNLSAGAVALASGVDLTKIHGVALTETVNGYLAAAFIKLFDVATPLLVASEAMRGTDSAALASNYTATRAGYLNNIDNANLATIANISTLTATEIAYLNASISSRSSHAASAIWSVGTRALTDKAGFGLSTAGILAIWHQLTANIVTASTIGKLLKDDINATISSRSLHDAAAVWSAGSRALSTPNDYKADVSSLALEATLTAMKGATFAGATDSLEAIRDRGDAAWITGTAGSDRLLMVDTTIATLASQTSFTLTAGSADDDAYNNCTIVIEDSAAATQKAMGLVLNYTGGTKTITLKYDPAIFTMAVGDKVYILAENALKATLANRQLNVAADGDLAGNVDGAVGSVTADVGITQAGADKVWGTAARALTDKAGFALSSAAITAIFNKDISAYSGAGYAGTYLKNLYDNQGNWLTATGFSTHNAAAIWSAGSRTLSTPSDYKADISALALEATLSDIKGTGFAKDTHSLPQCLTATGFSTHAAADIWSVGTRALTDKAGFALSTAGITSIWNKNISAFSGAGYAGTYVKTLYDDWLNDGRLDLLLDRVLTATEIKQVSVNDIAATTTKFDTTLTEGNDFWNRGAILFTSGNNAGQMRRIKNFANTNGEITVQTALHAAPANADKFIIVAARAFLTVDISDISDAIWDELIAGHTVVGSFGAKNQKVVPSETIANYKADVSALALEATLTAMKGSGFLTGTDSLEAIRNRGDSAWITGGGGSAADFADAVWDELQSGHTDVGSFGKYLDTEVSGVGGIGSGALSCTWTQKDDGGVPMDNVNVWITTDSAGANVIAGTIITDAQGEVTFMLDPGITYYVWRERSGFNFTNPQVWAIS